MIVEFVNNIQLNAKTTYGRRGIIKLLHEEKIWDRWRKLKEQQER